MVVKSSELPPVSVKDAAQTSEGLHNKAICLLHRAARVRMGANCQPSVPSKLGQGIRNQPHDIPPAAAYGVYSTTAYTSG